MLLDGLIFVVFASALGWASEINSTRRKTNIRPREVGSRDGRVLVGEGERDGGELTFSTIITRAKRGRTQFASHLDCTVSFGSV